MWTTEMLQAHLWQIQLIATQSAYDCQLMRLRTITSNLVTSREMTAAALERLRTSERGVAEMAHRVRAISRLPDPLNRTLATTELDHDLTLHKVSCPLGVVAVIFESRPDVIPQVAALALSPVML